MAAASLVLCSPLCFLIAKFKHSAAKPLKSAVCDFYCVKDLAKAKRVLLRDIDSIRLEINLPHIPARREGDNRATRIVDDIILRHRPTVVLGRESEARLLAEVRFRQSGYDAVCSVVRRGSGRVNKGERENGESNG